MKIFSLRFVCICAFSLYCFQTTAQPKHDSVDSALIISLTRLTSKVTLLNDYKKTSDGKAKVIGLVRLSMSPHFTQTEKRNYALEALALSRKQNYYSGVSLSFLALSAVSRKFSEIDSCLQFVKAGGDRNLILLTQLNASSSFLSFGSKYVDAFRLLSQFVNVYPIRTDSNSFSKAWNMLGEVYRAVHNYQKALVCYRKSLSYSFLNGRFINTSPVINLGTIHRYLGDYDSALYYYDQAVKLASYKNASMEPYVNFRRAQVAALKKDYSSALQLALKSMYRYDSINNGGGEVLAGSTLAQIYHQLGNEPECLRYGEKAIQTGLKINYNSEELRDVCLTVANVYESNQQFANANRYQKIYSQLRDSIFGPAVNLKLFNEQLNLEIHNQELQNQLAVKKEELAHREVVTQQRVIISVVMALLFFIVVSVKFYRRNKTIARLNSELRSKQDEVLAQSEELKATNEEIEMLNSNLEKLVQERSKKVIEQNAKLQEYSYFNAHKVRGPLARILGLVNILEVELTQQSMLDFSRMLKQAGEELDHSIREINQVIEDDPRAGV